MTTQNAGVSQTVLNQALAKTSGFTLPSGGQNNDTTSNAQSPVPTINALSNGAMFINSCLGDLHSVSPPGINYSVLNVTKPSDINGPVGFRDSILQNQAMVDALTNTTRRLADSQVNEVLSKRSFGAQLATLLKGSVSSNQKFGDACFSNLFDPTGVPFLASAFDLAGKATRIAIMHALHSRFASAGTIQVANADYHDGTTTTNAGIHSQVASILQDWIVSSHLEATQGGPNAARTSICFLISDGACAMSTQGGGQCVANNDRAEHAMMVAFVYNSTGPVTLRHLNVMNTAEASVTTTVAGAGPERVAAAAGATYAALSSAGLDAGALAFLSSTFGLTQDQVAQLNAKA
jgi:hypothetical protein